MVQPNIALHFCEASPVRITGVQTYTTGETKRIALRKKTSPRCMCLLDLGLVSLFSNCLTRKHAIKDTENRQKPSTLGRKPEEHESMCFFLQWGLPDSNIS